MEIEKEDEYEIVKKNKFIKTPINNNIIIKIVLDDKTLSNY